MMKVSHIVTLLVTLFATLLVGATAEAEEQKAGNLRALGGNPNETQDEAAALLTELRIVSGRQSRPISAFNINRLYNLRLISRQVFQSECSAWPCFENGEAKQVAVCVNDQTICVAAQSDQGIIAAGGSCGECE